MSEKKTSYSISQVAALFQLSVPTIRYYDSQGLIPHLQRAANGQRRFSRDNLETINMIVCLKKTGMSIKDIKQFISWCSQGDATLTNRQAMFHHLRDSLKKQMNELQSMIDAVNFKCRYYDGAVACGHEAPVKKALRDQKPASLRLPIDHQ